MVLGTLPKGEHKLHQAPHLQLQPWRDKHLGRARQGWRGAGDQQASPRCGIHRLRLERPEAVGWIWSLADFTQPISLEVCWPECPHRAGKTRVPSKGRENLCASAGATEPRACASLRGGGAASQHLSHFFMASSRQGPEGGCSVCVLVWGWGAVFIFFLVSVYEKLGFPRMLTCP